MSVSIIPWIVVVIFGGIFIFAGVREYLHRRTHGPPEDPRAGFEFDEDAPSYEEPETPESDAPDDPPGEPGDDTDAAPPGGDDPDPTRTPDPDTPDRSEPPR